MEGPGRKGGESWAMSFPIAEKKSCPINSSPQTTTLLHTPKSLSIESYLTPVLLGYPKRREFH
jgi:hypothetical protein